MLTGKKKRRSHITLLFSGTVHHHLAELACDLAASELHPPENPAVHYDNLLLTADKFIKSIFLIESLYFHFII
jgi:hypothetical protein